MTTSQPRLFFFSARAHFQGRDASSRHALQCPPAAFAAEHPKWQPQVRSRGFVPLPRAMRVEDALPARGSSLRARALPPLSVWSWRGRPEGVKNGVEAATEQQVWQFRHLRIALLDRLKIYRN